MILEEGGICRFMQLPIETCRQAAGLNANGWPEWANSRPLSGQYADAGDSLKLVIVRDMWLTGFDSPSMHTIYIDKPMKGHGLMQAIARVNRVFRDKPAGLIVDYIGVAQNLKNALGQYSATDQRQTGIKEDDAVQALLKTFE